MRSDACFRARYDFIGISFLFYESNSISGSFFRYFFFTLFLFFITIVKNDFVLSVKWELYSWFPYAAKRERTRIRGTNSILYKCDGKHPVWTIYNDLLRESSWLFTYWHSGMFGWWQTRMLWIEWSRKTPKNRMRSGKQRKKTRIYMVAAAIQQQPI